MNAAGLAKNAPHLERVQDAARKAGVTIKVDDAQGTAQAEGTSQDAEDGGIDPDDIPAAMPSTRASSRQLKMLNLVCKTCARSK